LDPLAIMPGQYKLKKCKFCSIDHRRRGPYCSQGCASRDREPTEAMRQGMRRVAIEYNQTPEAIAKHKQFNTPLATMTVDEFAVDVPTIRDYDDLPEGYDRGESW